MGIFRTNCEHAFEGAISDDLRADFAVLGQGNWLPPVRAFWDAFAPVHGERFAEARTLDMIETLSPVAKMLRYAGRGHGDAAEATRPDLIAFFVQRMRHMDGRVGAA